MFSIYRITNSVNGLQYIGQTKNTVRYRWNQHCREARRRTVNHPLYNAIKKYGKESFIVDHIDTCNSADEANAMEVLLIRDCGTLSPHGYNVMYGGRNGEMPEHVRRKISNARRGVPLSESHRQALTGITHKIDPSNSSGWPKGKPRTDQDKRKISIALKGKKKPPRTAEHCAALRIAGLKGLAVRWKKVKNLSNAPLPDAAAHKVD